MFKLDFNNTITPHFVSNDQSEFRFNSIQKNGLPIELVVLISEYPINYLPNVYNLSFGPSGSDGTINDSIRINHRDINLVISSIIIYAVTFLSGKTDTYIGIDGSDDTRAYLYHRLCKFNHKELSSMIVPVGVDWYVRLLRNRDIERDKRGNPLFKPRPEPFDLKRNPNDLYRYYIFSLNE